ncbi:hypothetical protein [Acinetobacter colistiniresistens]|uniref:hypothetical protein n=1 Tax=Acinetobacter colistiniresistens TaxID=280145 RepID=UPI002FE36473
MAVPVQTPFIEYTANGVTTSFDLGFDCDESEYLIVTLDGDDAPVGSWSLTGTTIIFLSAPGNGVIVGILRNTPLERTTNYQLYDNSLKPKPVNKDFDLIWWKLQEIWVQITLIWSALHSKVNLLWAALNKEVKDRIQGDLDIRAWVQVLLNNIAVDGILNTLAITSIDSINDLKDIVPWNGRIIYVKSYYLGLNKGGGTRIYDFSRRNTNDGYLCINGWVLQATASTSPFMAGAKGDGLFDDTTAIQKHVNANNVVNMQNGKWKITKKILIPSRRVIDLRGSDLHADNGADPIFEFEIAGDGLYILHGGGAITGTADSFLKCAGKTNTPSSIGDYASQIRLDGVLISSETIDKFLDFQMAVRQVFMHKVHAYARNGINANGKCVEVKGHGCIIYGSTDSVATYGIKLRAPGGGASYSEGFHFTDCTIDNFGKTYDVTDIYVMSITGGHSGCVLGGKVAVFGQPNSTACRDIKFNGVNIHGAIEFAPVGGIDYHSKFTGCVTEACEGINIHIKNNAASIDISDHKFHTSKNGVAIVCNNNNYNINVNGISCDSTFIGGVQINGENGSNCSIRNVAYAGLGDSVYIERPVLLSGIPITSANVLKYLQKFNSDSLYGVRSVGATIASVDSWFAKGETGEFICELSFSGADANTQRFDINLPDNVEVPNGTGWSSRIVMPRMANGRISVRIPYRVTADMVNQTVSIKNALGNPINVDYHSNFGFKRDW